MDPVIVLVGDLERCNSMNSSPERLADQFRVFILLPEKPCIDTGSNNSAKECVRVFVGIPFPITLFIAKRSGMRREKHQPVVVGVIHCKLNVSKSACPQLLHRVRNICQLSKALRKLSEIGSAYLAEQGFLIREVEVDGGGRILDALRDLSHRDPLIATFHKQFSCRIENPFPYYVPLTLTALFNSHELISTFGVN